MDTDPTQTPPSEPTSDVPAAVEAGAPAITSDEKTMGLLAHLLALFTGFVGPLIIFLIKKDDSAYVRAQSLEALNFQITVMLAFVICFILTFVVIGALLAPVVIIANLVLVIIATIKASEGKLYTYPFALRLIK